MHEFGAPVSDKIESSGDHACVSRKFGHCRRTIIASDIELLLIRTVTELRSQGERLNGAVAIVTELNPQGQCLNGEVAIAT